MDMGKNISPWMSFMSPSIGQIDQWGHERVVSDPMVVSLELLRSEYTPMGRKSNCTENVDKCLVKFCVKSMTKNQNLHMLQMSTPLYRDH